MRAVPLLVVSVLLFDTTVPILPSGPLVWKLTATRLLFVAGFVALLAAGARTRHFRSRLDISIALLLVASLVSMAHGLSGSALESLVSELALYYLTLALLRLESAAAWVLATVALAAVATTSGVALEQVARQVNTGFCRSGLTDVACGPQTLMRATGTFTNPDVMAAGILLLGPLAALLPSRIPGRVGRVLVALVIVLASAGLVVTFSRSAYLGALGGVAALVLVARYRAGRWRRGYTWGLFALGGLVVAAFASGLAGRYGLRNAVWGRAIRIASHHLLRGVGLGGSKAALGTIQGQVIYHAHNLWLNWLLVTGVLGLAAVVAITFVSLRRIFALAVAGSRMGQAAMVALVAFYVGGLFDDASYLHNIGLMWWLVTAIAMSTTPGSARHGAPAIAKARPGRPG